MSDVKVSTLHSMYHGNGKQKFCETFTVCKIADFFSKMVYFLILNNRDLVEIQNKSTLDITSKQYVHTAFVAIILI